MHFVLTQIINGEKHIRPPSQGATRLLSRPATTKKPGAATGCGSDRYSTTGRRQDQYNNAYDNQQPVSELKNQIMSLSLRIRVVCSCSEIVGIVVFSAAAAAGPSPTPPGLLLCLSKTPPLFDLQAMLGLDKLPIQLGI